MFSVLQEAWWIVIAPMVLIAIFYWPGRLILRVVSKGRYPPSGNKTHNIEFVSLVALAIFLIVLAVIYS